MSGMQQRFESTSPFSDLKMSQDQRQVPETGVVAARGSQARQALAAECDSCGRWLTGIPRTERRRTDMRQHGVALCTHSPGAGTERPSLNRKRDAADKTAGANQGGTPCWQKSSCSDWKRQRERPRKRPTARGSSRSHCRLRRRPRFPTYRQLLLKKTPRPVTHGQRAGTCHLPPVGRLAQMTNRLTREPAGRCGAADTQPSKRKPRACRGFQLSLTKEKA